MVISRLVAAVLAVAAITGGPAWSRDLGDSGRKVYVFAAETADGGGSYRLDVAAGRQGRAATLSGPATLAHPLIDCGDADWFCVASDRQGMAFVAPRVCGDPRVGDVWRRAGQTLVVLQRRDPSPLPPGEGGGAPPIPADADISSLLLLGDPARPNIVYQYAMSRGVIGAFVRRSSADPSPYDEALAGRLEPSAGRAARGRAVHFWLLPVAPLVPTDLARCRFTP